MRSNQILMNILTAPEVITPKVVNMDQVKFAEEGNPVEIDQEELQTTLLTLLDDTQITAVVSFGVYQNYFAVTDILEFDASLIPTQP